MSCVGPTKRELLRNVKQKQTALAAQNKQIEEYRNRLEQLENKVKHQLSRNKSQDSSSNLLDVRNPDKKLTNVSLMSNQSISNNNYKEPTRLGLRTGTIIGASRSSSNLANNTQNSIRSSVNSVTSNINYNYKSIRPVEYMDNVSRMIIKPAPIEIYVKQRQQYPQTVSLPANLDRHSNTIKENNTMYHSPNEPTNEPIYKHDRNCCYYVHLPPNNLNTCSNKNICLCNDGCKCQRICNRCINACNECRLRNNINRTTNVKSSHVHTKCYSEQQPSNCSCGCRPNIFVCCNNCSCTCCKNN